MALLPFRNADTALFYDFLGTVDQFISNPTTRYNGYILDITPAVAQVLVADNFSLIRAKSAPVNVPLIGPVWDIVAIPRAALTLNSNQSLNVVSQVNSAGYLYVVGNGHTITFTEGSFSGQTTTQTDGVTVFFYTNYGGTRNIEVQNDDNNNGGGGGSNGGIALPSGNTGEVLTRQANGTWAAQVKTRGVVNIEDFGASTTGNDADNAQAIASAIATGMDVYVPIGTFPTNGDIELQTAGQRLFGEGVGSCLQITGGNFGVNAVAGSNKIHDLNITATGSQMAIVRIAAGVMEDVTINGDGSATNAVFCDGLSNIYDANPIRLHRLQITGAQFGLMAENNANVEVSNSSIWAMPEAGIYMLAALLRVTACDIHDCGCALKVTAVGGDREIEVSGGRMFDCNEVLYMRDLIGARFTGVAFGSQRNSACIITLENTAYTYFMNCVFYVDNVYLSNNNVVKRFSNDVVSANVHHTSGDSW